MARISPKLFKLSVALVICLALVFWNPKKLFDPFREVVFVAAYPFQKTFYLISKKTQKLFYVLSSISRLKNENERLLKENAQLVSHVADLQAQKNENELLRRELGLVPREEYELAAAFVIGQDPRGTGSWIMADKGRSDGISVDMPVIVSDGILVGRVAEIFEKSSKVILLTDSSTSINVTDLVTGARGILVGKYNLGLALGMVQQTDVLNSGDEVVTSGLGGLMPKGLLIGNIQQVGTTQDKLFQEALVGSKVKYENLEVVFIIKEIKNASQ